MFERLAIPHPIAPAELDACLASGWYRMGQTVFTTDYLCFAGALYRAIWLRVGLPNFLGGKTFQRLRQRNRDLSAVLRPALPGAEQERLWSTYRRSVSFEPAENVNALLYRFGVGEEDYFRTHELCLYRGERLVACSYFDTGQHSAEGISAFYDPEFRNRSLGKYLIYLQAQYCRNRGLLWFYPGYFVPGHAHLDYKLSIGRTSLEFFDPLLRDWFPIEQFCDPGIPLGAGKRFLQMMELWSDSKEDF